MDYNNDQEWQSYYAAMMMENSPASYFKRSASSPYDRDDDRIDDDGDRFYEGDDIGCDVGYNDDEERDEEEREEADEEEETPARGDGAPTSPCGDRRGGTKRRSSKKRKRRDPNKPKGCLTAVLMYSNANRERVKTENPDLKFGDVVSAASAHMLCVCHTTSIERRIASASIFYFLMLYHPTSSRPCFLFHPSPHVRSTIEGPSPLGGILLSPSRGCSDLAEGVGRRQGPIQS